MRDARLPPEGPGQGCRVFSADVTREELLAAGLTAEAADELLAFAALLKARQVARGGTPYQQADNPTSLKRLPP